MYAIIETGGKQYKVCEGDVIYIEKLGLEAEAKVEFKNISLISDGDKITVGSPFVSGAMVSGNVLANGKGKKVIVYKYKSKKTFHKKKGHRQPFTKVQIEKISV